MKSRVVFFQWLDAQTHGGWSSDGLEPALCCATGTVAEETKEKITLCIATSRDEGGEVMTNPRMSIPKGWIKGPITTLAWIEDSQLRRK